MRPRANVRSSTAVGVKCVDGVVLAVEKSLVSKMMVQNTHKRIFHLDEHVGLAVSGVQADARNLMNRGRGEATQYRSTYGDPIPGEVMATRLAGYMHLHTMYWWLRPFGTSALIGSYDQEGPQLHDVDPSGLSYVRRAQPHPSHGLCALPARPPRGPAHPLTQALPASSRLPACRAQRHFAAAVGKAKTAAKSQLEKLPLATLTCRQAVPELAKMCAPRPRSSRPGRSAGGLARLAACRRGALAFPSPAALRVPARPPWCARAQHVQHP